MFAPWNDTNLYYLAPNGGVENGTTGWGVMGGGTLSSATSPVHGGARSLLLTGRTAAWNGPAQDVTSRLTNGKSRGEVWIAPRAGLTVVVELGHRQAGSDRHAIQLHKMYSCKDSARRYRAAGRTVRDDGGYMRRWDPSFTDELPRY